jgi:hypothetical protein
MQRQTSNTPSIQAADVCFIRPIALPHFATRFEEIKNSSLPFLYSLKDYVQYYTDLEVKSSPTQRKYTTPYTISNIGALRPLDKRHALNSYWRWIRFIIKNEKSALSNPPEILLLLPLKIDLGLITIKSDGFTFPAKIFGYIFPFGSCCINMNVKMRNIDLNCDEFIELYPKFLRYNIAENKTFRSFSEDIAQMLIESIFGKGQKLEANEPIHTLILLRSTSSQFRFDEVENPDHIVAITAILKGKKISDIASLNRDLVSKDLTNSRWLERRKRELLFFTPKTSLLYPSTEWTQGIATSRERNHKLSCMRDNYQSFFNLTFAINKFLENSALPYKDRIPSWRLTQLRDCFVKQFPENYKQSAAPVYFKHALESLAKSIKLYQHIQSFAST